MHSSYSEEAWKLSAVNWQPIHTAPMDGTRILLADSKFFSAGQRAFRIEDSLTIRGYDDDGSGRHSVKLFLEKIPNPNAGKRHEWWSIDNPCAFAEADEQYPDYDRNFDGFEPTHWAPLFAAPTQS